MLDIYALFDTDANDFIKIGGKVAWPSRSAVKSAYNLAYTDHGKNGQPKIDEQDVVKVVNLGKLWETIETVKEKCCGA